jgi:pyruvate dehydrogenase E2 component (dihydrolipoamide acetyltransferase)
MNELSTKRFASPRARRALRSFGIDASRVTGTGPNGRIVEADVLALSKKANGGTSAMRQAIAQRTSESAAKIPHFYLRATADVTSLVDTRRQIVERIEKTANVRITYTDFLLRAVALALREQPRANSIWEDNGCVQLEQTGVGLVLALDEGMIIPVIGGADTLSVAAIARRRSDLAADAELQKRLASQRASISLSNLGNSRVDEFDAIIPTGQSMILAAGRIALRPHIVDGKLEARQTLNLSLALDHRVHDGAPAAKFLDRIIQFLENPATLLIQEVVT